MSSDLVNDIKLVFTVGLVLLVLVVLLHEWVLNRVSRSLEKKTTSNRGVWTKQCSRRQSKPGVSEQHWTYGKDTERFIVFHSAMNLPTIGSPLWLGVFNLVSEKATTVQEKVQEEDIREPENDRGSWYSMPEEDQDHRRSDWIDQRQWSSGDFILILSCVSSRQWIIHFFLSQSVLWVKSE